MSNEQRAEKRITSSDAGVLDVHSVFYTIQGEGPFAGRPAVFVRLAGCNLQCPLCDTDYTSTREPCGPNRLVQRVYDVDTLRRTTLIVLTGGEPFRQPIEAFVRAAVRAGYLVQIETNGTLPDPGLPGSVQIVVSPKTGTVHTSIERRANAYKYVARTGDLDPDGLPRSALEHPAAPRLARPPHGVPVYLQPTDEGAEIVNRANLEACAASCLKHGYNLSIQLHKTIGVP